MSRADRVELQSGVVNIAGAIREVARLANRAGLEGYHVDDVEVGLDTDAWDGMASPPKSTPSVRFAREADPVRTADWLKRLIEQARAGSRGVKAKVA